MSTLVACVLAGGTGTRLYPASRSDRPKQFHAFGGDRSLLQRTVDRVSFAEETVVLTGEAHVDLVREHVPDADVLVEPAGRDTGPALVYAAARLRERFDDAVLLSVPSDHAVTGDFETPARTAARVARETGGLVTMGVEPTRPATGYGYLAPGEDRGDYAVLESFREKPDRETAGRLVDEGCLWNAGIFAWTPDALLSAAADSPLAALAEAADSGGEDALEAAFHGVPAESIDYAVMERVEEAYLVPLSVGWDDLGTWDAMARQGDRDADGNAVLGNATTVDTRDLVVATDADTHVSAVGVEDLVVAAYGDRVLVVPRGETQRVRDLVARLRDEELF